MASRLSRRGFLGLLSAGVVGACVVSKVPTGWLPQPVRTRAACEYLRRSFNEHIAQRMQNGANQWEALPSRMEVGRELFEAYASEIEMLVRFTSDGQNPFVEPTLLFKCVRLSEVGQGWAVTCVA